MSLADRFWLKVDVREPDSCWEWTAYRDKTGYGTFGIDGKKERAPRVAWALASGEIPDGLCVLHTCDNPPCCNPKHLFLGTRADNVQDAIRKGRHITGEMVGGSKLTEDNVHLIRHCLDLGCKQRETADVFRVSEMTISDIKLNKTWRRI